MTFLLLVLEESMSGWCPKTSKLGGLLKCTHEPRKTGTLGAMLKSATQFNADMTAHCDVAPNPEKQSRMKHSKDKTSFLDESSILAHAAEVLTQVEGSRLKKIIWFVEMLGSEAHHPAWS